MMFKRHCLFMLLVWLVLLGISSVIAQDHQVALEWDPVTTVESDAVLYEVVEEIALDGAEAYILDLSDVDQPPGITYLMSLDLSEAAGNIDITVAMRDNITNMSDLNYHYQIQQNGDQTIERTVIEPLETGPSESSYAVTLQGQNELAIVYQNAEAGFYFMMNGHLRGRVAPGHDLTALEFTGSADSGQVKFMMLRIMEPNPESITNTFGPDGGEMDLRCNGVTGTVNFPPGALNNSSSVRIGCPPPKDIGSVRDHIQNLLTNHLSGYMDAFPQLSGVVEHVSVLGLFEVHADNKGPFNPAIEVTIPVSGTFANFDDLDPNTLKNILPFFSYPPGHPEEVAPVSPGYYEIVGFDPEGSGVVVKLRELSSIYVVTAIEQGRDQGRLIFGDFNVVNCLDNGCQVDASSTDVGARIIDRGEIVVSTGGINLPFLDIENDGESGFWVDVAAELSQRLFGEVYPVTWYDNGFFDPYFLDEDEADLLWGFAHVQDWDDLVEWSPPFFVDSIRFLGPSDYAGSDLPYDSVVCLYGNDRNANQAINTLEAAGIDYVQVESWDIAVAMQAAGECGDVLAGYSFLLHTNAYFSEGELVVFGEPIGAVPIAIASTVDDPEFASLLDQAMTSMIEDGTLADLYERWFGEPMPWSADEILNMPPY